jgi:CBS domain containing-hemolysin-like protein
MMVGASAADVFGSARVGLASAVMTVLILVLSEIIPKTIGAASWRALAPVLAPVVWLLIKLLWPLVVLSQQITKLIARGRPLGSFQREELAAMAELGAAEGRLAPRELRVLTNLLRFHSVRTESIMTPRTVVFALDESLTVREAMDRHARIAYSRIPLYRSKIDDVTGVMLKADLFLASACDRHETRLAELRRPIRGVAGSLPLMALFELLIEEGQHIALVVDEYGGTAGLVTLEDVIETLLGLEIVDELDTTTDLQELARKLWRERADRIETEAATAPAESPR